jgi:hypothetical protein
LRDNRNGDDSIDGFTKRVSYNPFRIRVSDVGTSDMDELRLRMRPWKDEIPDDIDELFSDCRLAQFAYVDGKPCGVFGWCEASPDFRERDLWLGNISVKKHPKIRDLIVCMKFCTYRKVSGHAYGGPAAIQEAALDHMPRQWRGQTGVTPLLAETSMFDADTGMCKQAYEASGWFRPKYQCHRSEDLPVKLLKLLTPSAKKTIWAVRKKVLPIEGEFTCES